MVLAGVRTCASFEGVIIPAWMGGVGCPTTERGGWEPARLPLTTGGNYFYEVSRNPARTFQVPLLPLAGGGRWGLRKCVGCYFRVHAPV